MIHRILLIVALFFPAGLHAQLYKDPQVPVEQRVQDLLSRMTPEEKFWQLFMIPGDLSIGKDKLKNGVFGFQVSAEGKTKDATQQLLTYNPGASAGESAKVINEIQRFFVEESRLGIPIIPFDEGLHGLVRSGATSFPQSIGLAATFDTVLMHDVARAIAAEMKTRGIRQVLSPVINIATDVRWGRVEESYGEDPYLASEMVVAYVSEFERTGVITTPKHLLANVGDGGRDSYPIHLNERYLREIHLPPFVACFTRGGTLSVMTSYNSLDGQACSANNWMLNTWLKKELGFKGFVISDANAVGGANVLHMTNKTYAESGADAINNGLDVIFQTSYDHYPLFIDGFLNGAIDQKTIDQAVARVLRAKFNLGLFENPYVDPKAAEAVNGSAKHREIALEAAKKSIVLLKNQDKILPLSKTLRSIAVIGADADEARLGGYSGPGNRKVSILEGIRAQGHEGTGAQGHEGTGALGHKGTGALGHKGTGALGGGPEIRYVRGCNREVVEFVPVPTEHLVPPGEPQPATGNRKPATGNRQPATGLLGEYFNNITFSGKPVLTRTDQQVRFQWTLFGPDQEKTGNSFYSVRWTGKLKSPGTGTYKIGIDGNDGYRIYLDDKLILENWVKRTREIRTVDYSFEAGREYKIRIEYYEPTGNAWFSLVWNAGVENHADRDIAEAVDLASESDVAVVVVGIEEGEFRDRALLGLPGRQEELIRRVAATGKPVVVVLVGGSAITMSGWIGSVDGILDVWYPGEAGGEAVAEVLFGDYNPAGRLPVTFPVHEGQVPLVYNHKPTGRGDDYMNLTGQPLFPFGFGLSYTTFEYSDIQLNKLAIKPGESAEVSFNLTNTGKVAGDEVVQLYIRDEYASVARPVIELKGFQRVYLKPGESKVITFEITPDLLTMLDKNLKPVIEPGSFRIMVGSSSKDIRLQINLSGL
jgi:beta-glucosidase